MEPDLVGHLELRQRQIRPTRVRIQPRNAFLICPTPRELVAIAQRKPTRSRELCCSSLASVHIRRNALRLLRPTSVVETTSEKIHMHYGLSSSIWIPMNFFTRTHPLPSYADVHNRNGDRDAT